MNSAPFFLRAKHWHIFIPLIAIPFVVMMIFMAIMGATFTASQPDGPEDIVWVFYFMPVMMILGVSVQYLWMWTVAVKLRDYIQVPERKPRVNLFKATFVISLIIMCIYPVSMVNFVVDMKPGGMPDPGAIISFVMMMFLCYFVLLFCLLNNNYVVTKTIRMAELQRKVTFNDFVGDFFFMLIFPVAIWFLQPRINDVINGKTAENPYKDGDLLD